MIAINEIANSLPLGLYKTIYVDDFAVCASDRNLPTIKRQPKLALNQITKWTKETGLTFSLTKTKVCIYVELMDAGK